MDVDSPGPVERAHPPETRLDSWKEVAAYLNRHVTTVRRWEKTEGLPVHRHVHDKLGSVYAYRSELDVWWRSRRLQLDRSQAPDADAHNELSETDALAEDAPGGAKPQVPIGPVHPAASQQVLTTRRRKMMVATSGLCVLAAGASALMMYGGWVLDARRPAVTSLAVLPLENLSGDPEQQYFADGVAEALIGQLAQIRALRVVSRTSAMVFKGSRQPLPEIARALGVDAILQGSVQRSHDQVRISVRLIDGRTDAHLWARDYERASGDIFALQAAVAQAVSEEIRIHVTAEKRARLNTVAVVDPAAHQEYMIGRYYLWGDNDEALRRSIAHFERATEIDPQYAAAYASLAHAWWKRGMWGQIGMAAAESPARAAGA
jgi:TolB-like protein